MNIIIRPATLVDAPVCGNIIYQAFQEISRFHGFLPDFPSPAHTTNLVIESLKDKDIISLVAEMDNEIVGSNFLDKRDSLYVVGPLSVKPGFQATGIGRLLMQGILQDLSLNHSVRLMQDAFNMTSFALYSSLGFKVRENLIWVTGKTINTNESSSIEVKPLTINDINECNKLCVKVLGFSRHRELLQAANNTGAYIAMSQGKIVAYATQLIHWASNHAVAENAQAMCDLLAKASFLLDKPLSFLLPIRQTEVLNWCLVQKLKLMTPRNQMSLGPYQAVQGCYLPSVGY
jgi:predicted N-acetyltransferase YhbS